MLACSLTICTVLFLLTQYTSIECEHFVYFFLCEIDVDGFNNHGVNGQFLSIYRNDYSDYSTCELSVDVTDSANLNAGLSYVSFWAITVA